MTKNDSYARLYSAMVEQFNRTVYTMSSMSADELTHVKSLIKNVKREGPNAGQYGYYANYPDSVMIADKLMKYYKLNSLIDLGSGPGHFITALKYLGYYEVQGVEIERSLVNMASVWNATVKYGNILEPVRNIQNFDVVYFYEPFTDASMAEVFVKNLENTMKKGQYIFYGQAGRIGNFLEESKHFKRLKQRGYIQVYKMI